MGIKGDTFELEIDGKTFTITRKSFPFREGVELEVELDGKVHRVSDRQLGEGEALRLITELIKVKTAL